MELTDGNLSMKVFFINLAKWLFVSTVVVPMSLYLMLFLINFSDQEQSSLVLDYETKLSIDESVPNASNGFLLALGLNAERGSNQLVIGVERLEKLKAQKAFGDNAPANIREEFFLLKTELSDLAQDCPSPESSIFDCLNTSTHHFEQAVTLLDKWQWYLDRYMHVLAAKEWHEPIIYNLYNFPSYGSLGLREGQNLLFLQSYLTLKQGNAVASSELISQDYQSWLRQLTANKALLSMVISLDRGNENLKWGKSLQEVLPNNFQLPSGWLVALEKSEIENVMRRTFLYEWQFGRTMLSDMMKNPEPSKSQLDSALSLMVLRYQPIQTSNLLAQLYEQGVNNALLGEKSYSAEGKSICTRELSFLDYMAFTYNPAGKLLACSGAPKMTEYMSKIQALESVRQETLKHINAEANHH